MEVAIANYSGQPLILLTSDTYFDKTYMVNSLQVGDILGKIGNKGWLKSIKSKADDIKDLITATKNKLGPLLKFHDFVLAGEDAVISNIFKPPVYMYCIGIIPSGTKLALSFSIFELQKMLMPYVDSEDLLTNVQIYIGADGTFYCDNVTADGDKVCQKPLPESAKYINQRYASSQGYELEQAPITAGIEEPGLNGNTVVLQLFMSSAPSVEGDDERNYIIQRTTVDWSSILGLAIFLFVILIAIVAVLLVMNKGGSIKIFNTTPEVPVPNITI